MLTATTTKMTGLDLGGPGGGPGNISTGHPPPASPIRSHLNSPRTLKELKSRPWSPPPGDDSLHTPRLTVTDGGHGTFSMSPVLPSSDMLTTPTLTTPFLAGPSGSSPPPPPAAAAASGRGVEEEVDYLTKAGPVLPLDSPIGLRSPSEGKVARRRQVTMKKANSTTSDNSSDTPTSPKDHHGVPSPAKPAAALPVPTTAATPATNNRLELPQEDPKPISRSPKQIWKNRFPASIAAAAAAAAAASSSSIAAEAPTTAKFSDFKHPASRPEPLSLTSRDKTVAAGPSAALVAQSPLKSPNWRAIFDRYGELKDWDTPAVLDRDTVFDFFPTPGTPRSSKLPPTPGAYRRDASPGLGPDGIYSMSGCDPRISPSGRSPRIEIPEQATDLSSSRGDSQGGGGPRSYPEEAAQDLSMPAKKGSLTSGEGSSPPGGGSSSEDMDMTSPPPPPVSMAPPPVTVTAPSSYQTTSGGGILNNIKQEYNSISQQQQQQKSSKQQLQQSTAVSAVTPQPQNAQKVEIKTEFKAEGEDGSNSHYSNGAEPQVEQPPPPPNNLYEAALRNHHAQQQQQHQQQQAAMGMAAVHAMSADPANFPAYFNQLYNRHLYAAQADLHHRLSPNSHPHSRHASGGGQATPILSQRVSPNPPPLIPEVVANGLSFQYNRLQQQQPPQQQQQQQSGGTTPYSTAAGSWPPQLNNTSPGPPTHLQLAAAAAAQSAAHAPSSLESLHPGWQQRVRNAEEEASVSPPHPFVPRKPSPTEALFTPGINHVQQPYSSHQSANKSETPKKRGRKPGSTMVGEDGDKANKPTKANKKGAKSAAESGGTKRVYSCPHCQRSYDWNYNLNRHLKYECGKENAFQCAKCGRKFPHKQNCVYHLKRKHKIICDSIDQYVSDGLVVFHGSASQAAAAGVEGATLG